MDNGLYLLSMATIKGKHIIISLAVGFILLLFCWIGANDYSYQHPGATTQGATPTHAFHSTIDSERNYTATSTRSYAPSNPQRHEILQTKVKGYREETYWGSEHPVDEKTRYYSNDEFNRYIEEKVESNDADVYWGAEY